MPNPDDVFRAGLSFVLQQEGGFSNDPADSGGATMHGITQKEYDSYLTRHGATPHSVKTIADLQVANIYREDYAKPIRFDSLVAGVPSLPKLAIALLDWSINHGPSGAIKDVQRCVGLPDSEVDGQMGPMTLEAIRAWVSIHSGDELVVGFDKARRDWYAADVRANASQRRFLTGWQNRVDDLDKFLASANFA